MTSKEETGNQEEIQLLEAEIKKFKSQEVKFKEDIKQYEIKTFENQQHIEQLKRQLENYKRQLESTSKLKQCIENNLEVKVKQLCDEINSKKAKLSNLKQEKNSLSDSLNTLKRELNQKNIENLSLQRKISEFDKLIASKTGLGIEFSPQLLSIVKELKGQVSSLEEFHKRRDQESDLMNQYFEEIEKIKSTKQQQLSQLQTKSKQKLSTLKTTYNNSLKSLLEQLSLLTQQNSDLKQQLLALSNPSLELNNQLVQLSSLTSENEQLKDFIKHKETTLETHEQIVKQLSFEIQKKGNRIADLEQNLAFIHAEKSSLQSSKENFPYVLKETLKWIANKKNNLKTALQCLDNEDQKEIKAAISEVGFNLNF